MENRILDILHDKNMTIAELSRRTGLHYTHLFSVVHKKDLGTVEIKTLKKIADALNVSVEDLYKIREE